jgi:PAS domain S-box-containing protein
VRSGDLKLSHDGHAVRNDPVAGSRGTCCSPPRDCPWGRTSEDLLKHQNSFFDAIHPDDRLRVLKIVQAESTCPYEVEYRIVRPDNSVRWIRDRGFPVHDTDDLVIRVAGVAEDVTEKRQLEAQLHHCTSRKNAGYRSLGRRCRPRF